MQLLTTYSFTVNDIHLITHALRKYSETATVGTLAKDALNLIEYIEEQKKEKGIK